MSYSDQIVGAAIFDLSGLPKEYFVPADRPDISWVQTIFQALGLQALLTSSLQLENFQYAIVYGAPLHAIIVRQTDCHVALLMHQNEALLSEEMIAWAVQFDPVVLTSDSRFVST